MDKLKLPKVSFIVTSFNYEEYIVETLTSIINQSYKNIEIIVVDDYSSDKSVEVINKFISKHRSLDIKLFVHEENKGQLSAIKTGLENASGQFISFIDSDDILHKDYAKTLLKVHLNSSVAFASAQNVEINQDNVIETIYSMSSFHKKDGEELKDLENLLKIDIDKIDYKIISTRTAPFGGWWWSAMSSSMFRKSVIDILLKYDTPENWRICPDKFLFNLGHLLGGSALVYAPLLAKRRHSNNAGYSSAVIGNVRYNNNEIRKINIDNNKKIRKDTLDFIQSNRKSFDELFGTHNVSKMVRTIYLSYLYCVVQVIKSII